MQENIEKHSETEIAIILPAPEPTIYSKDVIDAKCAEYTQSIANLQAEAQKWFDRQTKANELNVKTQAELEPVVENSENVVI